MQVRKTAESESMRRSGRDGNDRMACETADELRQKNWRFIVSEAQLSVCIPSKRVHVALAAQNEGKVGSCS